MAAYNEPQQAKDRWTTRLYQQHGLDASPTMTEIEPIATRLPIRRQKAPDFQTWG